MIDFTTTTLENNPTPFAMPQLHSFFITQALEKAGIEFECFNNSEIEEGIALLDLASASESVTRDFPTHTASEWICIIVSCVPHDVMLAQAKTLYEKPLAEELRQYLLDCVKRENSLGQGTAFIRFKTEDEYQTCFAEGLCLVIPTLEEFVNTAKDGEHTTINVVLDPALYKRSGKTVEYLGYTFEGSEGDVEWISSAVVFDIVRDSSANLGFQVADIALDINPMFARRTGRPVDGHTTFWLHTSEETYLPYANGLFFPRRPEGEQWISWDDPAAAPYIEELKASGWEGLAYL